MADEDANAAESRAPTFADVATLCGYLNAQDALYLVVGGFAIIQHGFLRATGNIDLLIEDSLENQKRVREALKSLPDQAILELGEDEDIREWVVLRVSAEILVDVMTAACGVSYPEAAPEIEVAQIEGVAIPFASARLMLRLKQTHRAKDEEDRIFLRWKLAQDGNPER